MRADTAIAIVDVLCFSSRAWVLNVLKSVSTVSAAGCSYFSREVRYLHQRQFYLAVGVREVRSTYQRSKFGS